MRIRKKLFFANNISKQSPLLLELALKRGVKLATTSFSNRIESGIENIILTVNFWF